MPLPLVRLDADVERIVEYLARSVVVMDTNDDSAEFQRIVDVVLRSGVESARYSVASSSPKSRTFYQRYTLHSELRVGAAPPPSMRVRPLREPKLIQYSSAPSAAAARATAMAAFSPAAARDVYARVLALCEVTSTPLGRGVYRACAAAQRAPPLYAELTTHAFAARASDAWIALLIDEARVARALETLYGALPVAVRDDSDDDESMCFSEDPVFELAPRRGIDARGVVGAARFDEMPVQQRPATPGLRDVAARHLFSDRLDGAQWARTVRALLERALAPLGAAALANAARRPVAFDDPRVLDELARADPMHVLERARATATLHVPPAAVDRALVHTMAEALRVRRRATDAEFRALYDDDAVRSAADQVLECVDGAMRVLERMRASSACVAFDQRRVVEAVDAAVGDATTARLAALLANGDALVNTLHVTRRRRARSRRQLVRCIVFENDVEPAVAMATAAGSMHQVYLMRRMQRLARSANAALVAVHFDRAALRAAVPTPLELVASVRGSMPALRDGRDFIVVWSLADYGRRAALVMAREHWLTLCRGETPRAAAYKLRSVTSRIVRAAPALARALRDASPPVVTRGLSALAIACGVRRVGTRLFDERHALDAVARLDRILERVVDAYATTTTTAQRRRVEALVDALIDALAVGDGAPLWSLLEAALLPRAERVECSRELATLVARGTSAAAAAVARGALDPASVTSAAVAELAATYASDSESDAGDASDDDDDVDDDVRAEVRADAVSVASAHIDAFHRRAHTLLLDAALDAQAPVVALASVRAGVDAHSRRRLAAATAPRWHVRAPPYALESWCEVAAEARRQRVCVATSDTARGRTLELFVVALECMLVDRSTRTEARDDERARIIEAVRVHAYADDEYARPVCVGEAPLLDMSEMGDAQTSQWRADNLFPLLQSVVVGTLPSTFDVDMERTTLMDDTDASRPRPLCDAAEGLLEHALTNYWQ